MEKPISLKLKDFKNDAVNLINNSGLPLFIIEPILREVLVAVQTKAEQEYQLDKRNYENSLQVKEQNNKEEGEDQND